jgi:signal transduction histidine kinase
MKRVKKIQSGIFEKAILIVKNIKFSYPTEVGLLAIIYFLMAKFGLGIEAVNGFAAPVWFPSGISLAALYLFGYRLWPGVFLGAFFVNLTTGAPFFTAFGMGAGNALEAVVGVSLLHRFGFQRSLDRVHDILVLALVAGPVSACISATIGVTSMLLWQVISPGAYGSTWVAWWIGDTLSDAIVAPFLLIWSFPFIWSPENRRRLVEGSALAAVLFLFTVFIFTRPPGTPPIAYAIFPPLIWAALRFDPRYVITSVFFMSIFAILNTAEGIGPFADGELSESLIYLQIYLGVISVSSFIFGAVISERDRLEKRKDDFLSMASHELKTPVTSMKIYSDILRKYLVDNDDPKLTKVVTHIIGQTDRMKELVSDLLDVSRIEAGKLQFTMEDFEIDALIQDVIDGLQPSTDKHKIMYKSKRGITVYGDKYRIYQVVTNLLSNSIKYSPQGGDITIKAGKEEKRVIVSVKDKGIGVAEDQQEKIFDRLYQAGGMQEKTYPGLGMGLYISKEIIRRHGGEIWVESKKDRGSTFYFSLPRKS